MIDQPDAAGGDDPLHIQRRIEITQAIKPITDSMSTFVARHDLNLLNGLLASEILGLEQAAYQRGLQAALDAAPEKKPLARLVDGKYVGLLSTNEINNDQAHWRSGANEAIDQYTAAITNLLKGNG